MIKNSTPSRITSVTSLKELNMKNRKLLTFFISLAAIIVLSIFGKETAAIITLYGVYCTGNVASKFSVTTTRKEE